MIFNRSSDAVVVLSGIAHGAILVHLICSLEGIDLTPGNLTHNFGDVHIYDDHIEAVKNILKKNHYHIQNLKLKIKKENNRF